MMGKNLKLDKDIKHFADELKKCFSKEEIEEIARATGFVNLLHQTITNNTQILSVWDEYFKRIRILDSTAFQVPENYNYFYTPCTILDEKSILLALNIHFEA